MLIDGLDEIQDASARIRFCRQIEQMSIAYPDAPVIVTSRIVGYREMRHRIGRAFEHVTVSDLSLEDKDDFARRWCDLTEVPERRAAAATELIRAIHSTDRIERLTGNPMLLTTLALVKRKVGKLPRRRADLYWEAVQVLLNWRSEVDEPMDPREALPQLEYVAYAMCQRGVQRLREDEIIDLFERMREEYPQIHAVRTHSTEEFLRLLERRTGILVEAGHVRYLGMTVPVFEFRHLTFQEYLAARALVDSHFPGWDRTRSLEEYVAPLPRPTTIQQEGQPEETTKSEITVNENWREVLRLCVACCSDTNVDNVLRAILNPLENEDASTSVRPRAVLASLCLADEPNASEEVAKTVLRAFAKHVDANDGKGLDTTSVDIATIELATSRWADMLGSFLIEEFHGRDATTRGNVLGLYAMIVAASAPQEETATREWLTERAAQLVSGDGTAAIDAALGIMALAFRNKVCSIPGMVDELLVMLTGSPLAVHAASWALLWLTDEGLKKNAWQPSGAALERIISVLSDPAVRPEPVRYLTEVLRCTRAPHAVEPLIRGLEHQNSDVRQAVAEALGTIADPRAVEPLAAIIRDENGDVRQAVIEALGKIKDPQAIEVLIGQLTSDDQGVRVGSLKALSQGRDQIDRKLLSQDFDASEPFLDPRTEIDQPRIRKAMEKLGMREKTVRRRYEALAQRFRLKLAWGVSRVVQPTNP